MDIYSHPKKMWFYHLFLQGESQTCMTVWSYFQEKKTILLNSDFFFSELELVTEWYLGISGKINCFGIKSSSEVNIVDFTCQMEYRR